MERRFTNHGPIKGGHTRSSSNTKDTMMDFDRDNFHADHHTFHNKNFGSSTGIFIDMYFGTATKKTTGGMGCTYKLIESEQNGTEMQIERVGPNR